MPEQDRREMRCGVAGICFDPPIVRLHHHNLLVLCRSLWGSGTTPQLGWLHISQAKLACTSFGSRRILSRESCRLRSKRECPIQLRIVITSVEAHSWSVWGRRLRPNRRKRRLKPRICFPKQSESSRKEKRTRKKSGGRRKNRGMKLSNGS